MALLRNFWLYAVSETAIGTLSKMSRRDVEIAMKREVDAWMGRECPFMLQRRQRSSESEWTANLVV